MIAARASSTVRSAARPDPTASRRSSGSSGSSESPAAKSTVPFPDRSRARRYHQMLSSTAATSTAISKPYKMADSGSRKAEECSRIGFTWCLRMYCEGS